MKKFSTTTIKAIGNYVYLLVDPTDNTIFYVGKGKANRVFMHEEHVRKAKGPFFNEKEKKISDILRSGKEVLKYIVRVNLTKDEAFTVESVIINLLGITELGDLNISVSLTNIQGGHGMRKNGMMLVDEVEKLYGVKPLTTRMVQHNLLCININRLYEDGKDLYEATRKSWVLNPENAKKCEFVASEYQGVIKALYEVNGEWYKCGDSAARRFQFDGASVTDENILKLYLNKRIEKSTNGKRPSRNPIRYIIKKK